MVKFSKEQLKQIFDAWLHDTSFEFLYQDEVKDIDSFADALQKNQDILLDMVNDAEKKVGGIAYMINEHNQGL